jgi:5-methylcytosine-specific restriction endonuclease McrA
MYVNRLWKRIMVGRAVTGETLEQEGLEQEGLEQEGLEQEGLEQEGLEQEGLEQERLQRIEEHKIRLSQRIEQERLQRIEQEQKQTKSKKRKGIPKAIKVVLWTMHFGECYHGNCYVCNRELKILDFEAGHIESVANGGSDNIANLKPICGLCNKSVGTTNLEIFKNNYLSRGSNIPVPTPAPRRPPTPAPRRPPTPAPRRPPTPAPRMDTQTDPTSNSSRNRSDVEFDGTSYTPVRVGALKKDSLRLMCKVCGISISRKNKGDLIEAILECMEDVFSLKTIYPDEADIEHID